jgi:anti-sigma factor RsiW
MQTNRLPEHPNDEMLLAYMDGETSRVRIGAIRSHLQSCWKCRSVLADLESQAEAISRLLIANSDSDIDRSVTAKEKFFQWRASFEKRQKSLFRFSSPLSLSNAVRVGFAQTEADVLFSLPV